MGDVLTQAFTQATSPAFTLWGTAVTGLEAVAFVLSLAMVVCNIRVIHWGWPLAALASALYFMLFWQARLYGQAALQVVFALFALWGWGQWLFGRRGGQALSIARLSARGRLLALGAGLVLWPLIAGFLARHTDSAAPLWDALPTAFSLVGQWLLARKYVENWPVWIGVNIASVALFVTQALWLTALLYALFGLLAVIGWRAWQRPVSRPPAT